MKARISVAIALLFAIFALPSAAAEEITIAAASDLQAVFQEVSAQFQKQTGNTAKLTFGSSGNFFTQIQNGAPFDLYFSADIEYPKKLESAGLAEPGTLYQYATGRIVLWVPNESKFDLAQGLKALLDSSVKKVAIANPAHAPYGRAAVAALQHEKLYDQVSPKFVQGENISQTMQFVASGNADVGIVALSVAMSPAMKDKGRYVEVPVDTYPPIEQAAVVLKSSQKKKTAKQFLDFLQTKTIADLMRSYGFSVPDGPKASQ